MSHHVPEFDEIRQLKERIRLLEETVEKLAAALEDALTHGNPKKGYATLSQAKSLLSKDSESPNVSGKEEE